MDKKDLILKENPTLKEFQGYVHQMLTDRGFAGKPIEQTFMKFLEESGEMARAAKHASKNIVKDKNDAAEDLPGEIADVFIYLLSICDHFDIDLEKAFRDKELKNKQRIWK